MKDIFDQLLLVSQMTKETHLDTLLDYRLTILNHDQQVEKARLKLPPKDIIEFTNSLKISHPVRGPVDFKVYPFQENLLKYLCNLTGTGVVCMGRQMGMDTCLAAYFLWEAITKPDQRILAVSSKFLYSLDFLGRIKFFIENSIADFPDILSYNKSTIEFANGSSIHLQVCNENAGRGQFFTHIGVIEAAYIPYSKLDAFLTNCEPNVYQGCQLVLSSTPQWTEGPFYDKYQNSTSRFFANCYDDPRRDQTWRDKTKAQIGAEKFAQEHEAQFIKRPNPTV